MLGFDTCTRFCHDDFDMKHTKSTEPNVLVDICLKDIQGIHPEVQNIVARTADVIYASAPDDFSELTLRYLLTIHPIHVVELETQLYVIAGFRSFELATLALTRESTITCMLHANIESKDLTNIAMIDIAGSPIMHSLGAKFVQQLQNLVQALGERVLTLFPRLQSIRRIRGQNKSTN